MNIPDKKKSHVGSLSQSQVDLVEQIKSLLNGFTYIEAKEIIDELNSRLGHISNVSYPVSDS